MTEEEKVIESEIQEKGLNAPRLSPNDIDSVIIGEDYHVFPGATLTVRCLVLRNGFTVTGESAAVSMENFDEELGRKIARSHARDKIWALEGYALRERLWNQAISGLAGQTASGLIGVMFSDNVEVDNGKA